MLQAPTFPRLADYVGIWALASDHATHLWQMVSKIDLRQHVETKPIPLAAISDKMPIPGGKNIAVIKLSGLLMKSQSSFGGTSTVQARREVRQAAQDNDIAGIVLQIESPGGTVAGTSDLADEVKAAGKQKPVWTFAEDLLASAAYWVASQTGRIVANSATALVGSIGTIQTIYDVSAAYEQQGVRTLMFKTGPFKGLGTPGAAISEDQVNHVQQLIDAVQTQFDAAVRSGRNLGARDLAAVRHGGVLAAQDAVNAKLIDGISSFDRFMSQFVAEVKNGGMKAKLGIPMRGFLALEGSDVSAMNGLPMLAADPVDPEDDEEDVDGEQDDEIDGDEEDVEEEQDDQDDEDEANSRTLPMLRQPA